MKKEVYEKFNQQDLECFNQITNILKNNGYSISVSLTNEWHDYKSINATHEWSSYKVSLLINAKNINSSADFSRAKFFGKLSEQEINEDLELILDSFYKWVTKSGTDDENDVIHFIDLKTIELLKQVLADYYEKTVGQVGVGSKFDRWTHKLFYKGFYTETTAKNETVIFSNNPAETPLRFESRPTKPRHFKNMVDGLSTMQNIKERYKEYIPMRMEPDFRNSNYHGIRWFVEEALTLERNLEILCS